MSYTDFTVRNVETQLNISLVKKSISLEIVEPVIPSFLLEYLERGKRAYNEKEKSRSEFLVAPVLLAVRAVLDEKLQIFSGQELNVDIERGLVGECDFILTKTEPTPVLKSPIISLVEAKNNDIPQGIGQCAAQMVGARVFNEQVGESFTDVFGCVTTGEIWQFLKLEGNTVIVDTDRYFIDNVGRILGVFKAIFDFYENE